MRLRVAQIKLHKMRNIYLVTLRLIVIANNPMPPGYFVGTLSDVLNVFDSEKEAKQRLQALSNEQLILWVWEVLSPVTTQEQTTVSGSLQWVAYNENWEYANAYFNFSKKHRCCVPEWQFKEVKMVPWPDHPFKLSWFSFKVALFIL